MASMDLGGYFTTLDSGGANTPQELVRQRDKLVAAIAGLDVDVVSVTGSENDDGAALDDLIATLDAGSPDTWAAVETGTIGTDATKVGIIYRTAVVAPLGAHTVLDGSIDAQFDDTENRPSLAQAFSRVGGARFTVVVNDLAARDADCAGDGDSGDGQGRCSASRTAAAEALVDWIAADPAASGDPDVLVLGTFNAHRTEDPIDVLRSAGFVDLLPGSSSSVLAGQSGSVDHAFASASLGGQVTGATVWHVNADEPALLDYNTESKSADDLVTLYAPTPYRSSSRDPLLVGINLAGERPVAGDDATTTAEDTSVVIDVAANDLDPNGDLDRASVTVVTPPSAGSVTVNADGTITYTPAPDAHGTDSLDYQICDTTGGCDRATITVTVEPVDDTPVATDVAATTSEDEAVVIDVTDDAADPDGDLDPDSVTVVGVPAHGTAVVGSPITYTPTPNFNGTDRFDYEICDTTGRCDQATVTVTVSAVNDAPVAARDVATVTSGARVTIDALSNDMDVDGRSDLDPDALTIVDGPSRGTATVDTSTRTISYTASVGQAGTDQLTYRICDRGGLCDTAAVDIRIDRQLPSPTPRPRPGTLPATGATVGALLTAAFVSVGAGSVLALSRRRRRIRR